MSETEATGDGRPRIGPLEVIWFLIVFGFLMFVVILPTTYI